MPRPPERRAPVHKAAPANPDTDARQAFAQLEKGHHRDAIAGFKALLKLERRPEWVAGMASAYAGRAQGLIDKGMLQEAISLWRSRAELCGTPLWEGPYAGWLVRDGRLAEVLAYLVAQRADPAKADSPAIGALEAQLAPALLSAPADVTSKIDPDSPLMRQRQPVLDALAAYAQNDAAALDAALANIPFRSPYRDLRSLLKALQTWETDRDAGREALSRLPATSAFDALLAPARVLTLTGLAQLKAWVKLTADQQALALGWLGVPAAVAPLLRALAVADPNSKPADLFELVLKNSRDLPAALATSLWCWLAVWAKRQGCNTPRIFGDPKDWQQECSTALAVELRGELSHAEDHWLDAVDYMEKSALASLRLPTALVLRRMANSPLHNGLDGTLDRSGIKYLTRSLALDPVDLPARLTLVAVARQKADLKLARRLLDDAPADVKKTPALLAEGVAVSLASGAFKKAITIAQGLLKQDPLNAGLRTQIGHAYLMHGIKQLQAKKSLAALKEFAAAKPWLSSPVDISRIVLLSSWAHSAGSPQRAELVQRAMQGWGQGLVAGWRYMQDALRLDPRLTLTRANSALREAGLDLKKPLTVSDVQALTAAMAEAPPLEKSKQSSLLPWRKAILGLFGTQTPSMADAISLCEALDRYHDHELQTKLASNCLKRWPNEPIFVYHDVKGQWKIDRFLSHSHLGRLDTALQRAKEAGNDKMGARLHALAEDIHRSMKRYFGAPFFDDDEDDDDDFDMDFDSESESGSQGSLLNAATAELGALLKGSPDMARALLQSMCDAIGLDAFLAQGRLRTDPQTYQQMESSAKGDRTVLKDLLLDFLVDEMMNVIPSSAKLPGKKR